MSAAETPAHQGLHTLYLDHHGWLKRWLQRRLGDAADAADLAQDTFLRLILKPTPTEFVGTAQARGYLRAMANGLCVDLWRRRSIEQAWLDELATRPEEVAPSAEHQAIVLEALHEVDAMLQRLPPKAARAFVMAVAGEMTHKDVARELGVSTRTVTTYVAQAMLHCLTLHARQVVYDVPQGGGAPAIASPAPDVA